MSVFTGSAVAIITPFHDDADKTINFDAFADFIDYQIEQGTDAIVVCGSTGEAATMTEEEHLQACKFVIDYTKKRVPVIAGSGSNCTRTSCYLSREIAGYGVDALLVITPYYNKATQEGLYQHFKTVCASAPSTPVIMYNVPSRTGCNLLPETAARIVKDVPNAVGIKEASGNISQIVRLMTLTDGNIDLYSGNDDETVPIMACGGKGVISVVANIAPKAMHDLCAKFLAGDVAGAMKLQRETETLFDDMFCEVNPIPVKKAVSVLGFNAGPLRMPLTELTPAHTDKLRADMKAFGIEVKA